MASFIEQARWYASYHQNAMTQYLHMAGALLLLLSAMILLGFIHLVIPGFLDIKFSEIAALVLLIYYFRLNWRIALALTPVFIILLWIAGLFIGAGLSAFSIWSFITIFILACLIQGIGYFIEGRRPPMMDNWLYDLAAPMFLTAEIFFMGGWMKHLKEEIYGQDAHKTHPHHKSRKSS